MDMSKSAWCQRLHEIHPIDRSQYIQANTPVWYNARRGRLTASTRAELIHDMRGIGKMTEDITSELQDEWQRDEFDNDAMAWGRNNEARALAALELETGLEISDPGLIFHWNMPFVAATPDGLGIDHAGNRVSIQIKCPYNPKRHLDNLYGGGAIKQQYWHQVQWEAWLLRANRIIFASYDPRQPLSTQLAVVDIPVKLDTQTRFDQNARMFQQGYDNKSLRSVAGVWSIMPGSIPEVFP